MPALTARWTTESPEVEVDVLPAKREQLTEPEPGVRSDPVQVGVLAVLPSSRGELVVADPVGASGAVSAELRGARERLDLVGLVKVEHRGRRLAAFRRARSGIARDRVGVLAHRIVERRGDELAVPVDRARLAAALVEHP